MHRGAEERVAFQPLVGRDPQQAKLAPAPELAGVRAIADQYSDGGRDDGIAFVRVCDGEGRDLYR